MNEKIRIVFDGPPGPKSGRFIEVENEHGEGISIGEWIEDGKFWYLEFDNPAFVVEASEANSIEIVRLLEIIEDYRKATSELLEVARLRGDNELPHPANDHLLWTARMQEAWDVLAEVSGE